MSQCYLSVVVPIFNEAESLVQLHAEILQACRTTQKPFEIIFVDDGSWDQTSLIMKELSPLVVVTLRKNFGQTAALDAGIKTAKGEVVVTLDGDLQNDPADIPLLLQEIDRGYDIVSGWRKDRKDPPMKRVISRVANILRKFFINDGIHDSGCSLKAYRRLCFETIDLYGEMHRFIPAILKLKGFVIGEVVVHHRPRAHGHTKYGWRRTVKGFLDMISVWFWKKFANRPLHLFGGFGLFLILVSFGSGIIAAFRKIFSGIDLSDTALTELSMFTFLGGIQFVVFGLLADMLSKTYYSSSHDKSYMIKEITYHE